VRLIGHYIGHEGSFSTHYKTEYLVWFEETRYVRNAIDREKEIKRFTRVQKEALISSMNPEWRFLNEEIVGNWPPSAEQMAAVKEKWARNGQRWR
jgi:putative endonuclease